ncbi:MAG: flippase-like domain-containing protein [Reyranella sp.]|uniref:lysylphosphatidylglycerol synthase transmembrane domain-containing protein n=1 Tax=Reyranella sp. TaxID=1929291 RepID=UPI001AD2280A|nr:lysylphosphatidylglycerol synthase transmembrane domain-containing protein [Reyranella sp.]MBN9089179.1 flippase-like domain-containing protein [Reyranella sp.]
MKSKLAVRLVVIAIFSVGAAWALTRLDWAAFQRRIIEASATDLALMLLMWVTALLLRPLRFQFLLRVLGHARVPYAQVWTANMLGMAVNSFTAMRAGDVVVALFLRHRLGIDIHRSLTVMAADALCDFLCVALLFLTALSFAPISAAWTEHAAPVLAVVFVGVMVAMALVIRLRSGVLAIADRVLARIDRPWAGRLREMAHDVLAGVAAISNWRVCVPLILISAGIWMVIGASYWFGLRAVSIEPSVAAASFAMSAVALSFIVPLGPGGLGAFEAAAVVALSTFNVPLEAAIPFAVIAHVFQLGSALLLAMLAVTTQKVDYRSLLKAAEQKR